MLLESPGPPKHFFNAQGFLPSPSADRRLRREPFAEVRRNVFAHVTVPLESTRMVRRVLVIAAPCRHHLRHGTGRSGGSHLPRSGRKYLRTSPCRGPSRAHGTLPSPSEEGDREVRTNYVSMFGRKYSRTPPCRCCCTSCQGVSMCSRHPAVNIQDTGRGGPDETTCPVSEETICFSHRAVGCARATKACSRARGTLPRSPLTAKIHSLQKGCRRCRHISLLDDTSAMFSEFHCGYPLLLLLHLLHLQNENSFVQK